MSPMTPMALHLEAIGDVGVKPGSAALAHLSADDADGVDRDATGGVPVPVSFRPAIVLLGPPSRGP
jgi:hypothetical protein